MGAISDTRIMELRESSRAEAERRPDNYLSGYPDLLLDHDERTCVMTRADVSRLLEYSSSVPTGVYLDKCWMMATPEVGDRFDKGKTLYLRAYRETTPPSDEVLIEWWEILLVD